MKVTVELVIASHPKRDVERTLRYAAQELTSAKESIKVVFSEEDSHKVLLQFWMPDKSHYKVVDEIDNEIKLSCWKFYEEVGSISFENDRKRKPRSRKRE